MHDVGLAHDKLRALYEEAFELGHRNRDLAAALSQMQEEHERLAAIADAQAQTAERWHAEAERRHHELERERHLPKLPYSRVALLALAVAVVSLVTGILLVPGSKEPSSQLAAAAPKAVVTVSIDPTPLPVPVTAMDCGATDFARLAVVTEAAGPDVVRAKLTELQSRQRVKNAGTAPLGITTVADACSFVAADISSGQWLVWAGPFSNAAAVGQFCTAMGFTDSWDCLPRHRP